MDQTTQTRFQQLAGILQAFGANDLGSVAPLDLSVPGNAAPALLPTAGVTLGGRGAVGPSASFVAARRFDPQSAQWRPFGGSGQLVRSLLRPVPAVVSAGPQVAMDFRAAPAIWNSRSKQWEQPDEAAAALPAATIPVGFSFWAASTITLAAQTTIVIQPPVIHLIIMAENLIVGDGVNVTWARPVQQVGATGRAGGPGASGAAGVGKATDGGTGGSGQPGAPGDPGFSGAGAPSLEIWALNIDHPLNIDLAGQAGGVGGGGGKGGTGGRGGDGSPEQSHTVIFTICDAGAGSGGNGGPGGPGGSGGMGGTGGAGGDYSFFGLDPANAVDG